MNKIHTYRQDMDSKLMTQPKGSEDLQHIQQQLGPVLKKFGVNCVNPLGGSLHLVKDYCIWILLNQPTTTGNVCVGPPLLLRTLSRHIDTYSKI